MIAADVKIVFVGATIVDYAGFEVVATWWSKVGIWSGDSEGKGKIDQGEQGWEDEVHCKCLYRGI